MAEDERVRKMATQEVMTSNKKRPLDFANDDEPDLKRRHVDGTIGKVSRSPAGSDSPGSPSSQLVVDKLKAACDYYRLPKSGRKNELVDRLDEYLTKALDRDTK